MYQGGCDTDVDKAEHRAARASRFIREGIRARQGVMLARSGLRSDAALGATTEKGVDGLRARKCIGHDSTGADLRSRTTCGDRIEAPAHVVVRRNFEKCLDMLRHRASKFGDQRRSDGPELNGGNRRPASTVPDAVKRLGARVADDDA